MADQTESIGIRDVVLVASYSWLGREEAIILVPGMPGTWNQQAVTEAPVLKPDQGWRYIDNNGGRCPQSPMEPLVRAVLHQQPEFDFSTIDLITDRHAITSLLRLVRGETKEFQCTAEVVGNTVFFNRNEAETKELVNTFCGCRQDFERHYLTFQEDCQDTASHHRIITYKLGSVRVMLRHAADGMFGAQLLDNGPSPRVADGSRVAETLYGNLLVRSGGQLVPRELTLELAVKRHKWSRDFYKEKIPQLWVSQTPHFINATPETHKWSKQPFERRDRVPKENIKIHDRPEVERDLSVWEAENQQMIIELQAQVSTVLQTLRSHAKMAGKTRYQVEYDPSRSDFSTKPLGEGSTGLPKDLVDRLGGAA